MRNRIIYPSSNTIQVTQIDAPTFSDVFGSYEIYYKFALMSYNTYANGGYKSILGVGFNASNFTNYGQLIDGYPNTFVTKFDKTIYSYGEFNSYRCKIDFIIEKNLIQSANRIVSYPFNLQLYKKNNFLLLIS